MPLDADMLVDRRRLQRQLISWRLLALLLSVLLVGVGALLSLNHAFPELIKDRDQIARISIEGFITDDLEQQMMLKKIAETDHIKAVLLRINSPGGTTTGGEILYEAIRRIAEKKPVVAVFGTVAASAAYIVGLACDHIVSRGNTVTGSVGVIFQSVEVSELLKKIGVNSATIRSGPFKAKPSLLEPIDKEGRALAEDLVAESHGWFLELVTKRRPVSPESIEGLKDGRIFSGRQAKKLNLIDTIGGQREAVQWLQSKREITIGLPVIDWRVQRSNSFKFLPKINQALSLLKGSDIHSLTFLERLQLDGLLSVWHSDR